MQVLGGEILEFEGKMRSHSAEFHDVSTGVEVGMITRRELRRLDPELHHQRI